MGPHLLEIFLKYWGVMKEMTLLRSQWARQNLLPQKSAPQQEVWEVCTLLGKSAGVLSDTMLSLYCPWIGQILGLQSTQLAN
jgi:hypothetical protein